MKHITLVLHKLSGSQDKYGTIVHEMDIPDDYTYIVLAFRILSEGFLKEEGFINYLEKDKEFVYDFFEDFKDSAVIKNLEEVIPQNKRIIFSPNYYNFPKDRCLTLNYVYIRKDMRNIRWKNTLRKLAADGFIDTSNDIMISQDTKENDDVEKLVVVKKSCWWMFEWF
jgi:hypothetical protein